MNARTKTGFLEATGDPGPNWPSLIGRTLACGGYKIAGYAETDGPRDPQGNRISGGRHGPATPGDITITDTDVTAPAA